MDRACKALSATLVILSLLLSGCAAPGMGGYDRPLIGTLRVIGPGVRLNDRITRDARVFDGDRIATGPDSSAYLYFRLGGYVHFDENTDPIFRIILDRIYQITDFRQGQFFAETSPQTRHTVETPDGPLETTGTRYNLQVQPEHSVLTVYRGQVRWLGHASRNIRPGEQMVYSEGQVVSVRRLSMAEMENTMRWRERFPPPRSQQLRIPWPPPWRHEPLPLPRPPPDPPPRPTRYPSTGTTLPSTGGSTIPIQ